MEHRGPKNPSMAMQTTEDARVAAEAAVIEAESGGMRIRRSGLTKPEVRTFATSAASLFLIVGRPLAPALSSWREVRRLGQHPNVTAFAPCGIARSFPTRHRANKALITKETSFPASSSYESTLQAQLHEMPSHLFPLCISTSLGDHLSTTTHQDLDRPQSPDRIHVESCDLQLQNARSLPALRLVRIPSPLARLRPSAAPSTRPQMQGPWVFIECCPAKRKY